MIRAGVELKRIYELAGKFLEARGHGSTFFCPCSDALPSLQDSSADTPFGVHTPRLMN